MSISAKKTRRKVLKLMGASAAAVGAASVLGGCDSSGAGPDAGGACDDFWLCGNFAPVQEVEASDLPVQGALPPSLRGTYLRNGPNPQSGTSAHWFAGDGMVHAVRIEDGRARWYRSRYVQTDVLGVPPLIGPPSLSQHPANTALVSHAGKLLALAEAGLPYEISPTDLRTLGTSDYGGVLTSAMTAHPKIDPETGELLFFGAGIETPAFDYHEVDPNGVISRSERIDIPSAVLSHDFQTTPSHSIFLDLPLVFDITLAMTSGGLGFRWQPENGARIGVLPRGSRPGAVQWFEIDPCFVFHTVNAHHDPADANIIHLDTVRYERQWVNGPADFDYPSTLSRFSVNLANGTVSRTTLDERSTEFPRIDPRRQGTTNQFSYAAVAPATSVGGAAEILKFDFASGQGSVARLPDDLLTGELAFTPDSETSGEDEGWLISFGYDPSTDGGRLLVLDASNINAGPVATVTLPRRVPYGFHGTFVED